LVDGEGCQRTFFKSSFITLRYYVSKISRNHYYSASVLKSIKGNAFTLLDERFSLGFCKVSIKVVIGPFPLRIILIISSNTTIP